MSITLENNLYPPIFESSYVPAFLFNSSCRIYFSISQFNTIQDLHTSYPLQITVRSQKTNQSVLSNIYYPSGIKLSSYEYDSTLNKYYFTISNNDISQGWTLNEYYKVQIRFTGADAATPSNTSAIDNWINQNITYFSQWSTVILIYPISQPTLTINFNQTFNQLNENKLYVVGEMTNNSQDKETLKSYQIQIYNSNNTLLFDSDTIYTNTYENPNEINYFVPYQNFQTNITYTMKITIVTKHLYTTSINYPFQAGLNKLDFQNITLISQAIDDSGLIKIEVHNSDASSSAQSGYIQGKNCIVKLMDTTFENNSVEYSFNQMYISSSSTVFPSGSQIILRRSSSKTNFNLWKQLINIKITETGLTDFIWEDYTVEPGVWYKYQILKRRKVNSEYVIYSKYTSALMVYTEDIFLSSKDKFPP